MSDHSARKFELTPEQRSQLIPNIDVDALQRFLYIAGKTDEERNSLLHIFLKQRNQSFQIMRSVGGDPAINALLDEIYAPTWEAWVSDAIEQSDAQLPGREIARARLEAKRRSASE